MCQYPVDLELNDVFIYSMSSDNNTSMKKIIITRTARSGTGYIAILLASLGVHCCEHENVFCPDTTRDGIESGPYTGGCELIACSIYLSINE